MKIFSQVLNYNKKDRQNRTKTNFSKRAGANIKCLKSEDEITHEKCEFNIDFLNRLLLNNVYTLFYLSFENYTLKKLLIIGT